MKLLLGLGNPGKDYADTRHNAGFLALDELAERHGGTWTHKRAYGADIAEVEIAGERVLLAKPRTYMNRSGAALDKLMRAFPAEAPDVLVLYDDADLPLGEVRVRAEGSAAGHNGMQSVMDRLGTNAVARVRMGIGRPDDARIPLDRWVLGRWNEDERAELPRLKEKTADAAEEWIGREA